MRVGGGLINSLFFKLATQTGSTKVIPIGLACLGSRVHLYRIIYTPRTRLLLIVATIELACFLTKPLIQSPPTNN